MCADPGNMPLSDNQRQGFQNKIIEAVARKMGAEVSYFWRPYLERGLTRETFANNECDVLLDMPAESASVLTTIPIYRSTYVLAYLADKHYDFKSLDDPRLKDLSIGTYQHSAIRIVLARYGIKNLASLRSSPRTRTCGPRTSRGARCRRLWTANSTWSASGVRSPAG